MNAQDAAVSLADIIKNYYMNKPNGQQKWGDSLYENTSKLQTLTYGKRTFERY